METVRGLGARAGGLGAFLVEELVAALACVDFLVSAFAFGFAAALLFAGAAFFAFAGFAFAADFFFGVALGLV